jgi:hypothetical protein
VLEGRRYQARLKMAGLPHHKTLDEFDVAFQPDLDPKRLAELRSLRFVERKVGCLILGPPGVGKSHLSVGLAMEALARGYLVRYTTLDDLVRGLRHAVVVESPGGVAPPGSHRTRREPLGSPGSCHPACGCEAVQWAKSRGCRRWTACSRSHARLSLPRSRLYFRIAHRTR